MFTEEILTREGYNEGYEQGVIDGNTEAYHIGYHQGSALGAELGFYYGVIDNYIKKNDNHNTRILKTINNLQKIIENFPIFNDKDVNILELAQNVRTQYKRLCAHLKINIKYNPETIDLTF